MGLSEMTLEELWQLFPIVLTEHSPAWAAQYAREEARLKTALKNDALRFHHIGSKRNGWKNPFFFYFLRLINRRVSGIMKGKKQCGGRRF